MKTLRFVWNHPMQRRVSLQTTVAVALVVILFSCAGYLALRATIFRASQDIAVGVARDLVGPAAQDLRSSGTLTVALQQPGGVVVEAVGGDGRVLRVPGEELQLVVEPQDLAVAAGDDGSVRRLGRTTDGQRFAVAAVPVPGTDDALLVARPLGPALEILQVQRLILLGISVAGVLAAAVAGIVVGLSGLRPMRQLTEAVRHATETQDYQRVAAPHARGDLLTLAASFNLLLASLARSRDRHSRLVADAGHELRTPLTSMRTNVDLLRTDLHRDKLSVDAKDAVLGDLHAQLAELSELIGDLVHVARDDTALAVAPLDVREVVEASLERVRHRAGGVTFGVELEPLFVVANAESLGRAVTNLLDNAVKWSPERGTVWVRLEGNRLRVSDAGPGIPDADLPYVFDRFFRGETGRKTTGTGLGLSIVAKTMDEIGGTVTAGRSAAGGAEFTLQLPGVTSREAVSSLLVPTA